MSRPKLLGISSSLRRESFSTAILRTLAEAAADKADLTVLTLHDVPLYDQDADTETSPAGVTALRAAIGAADGIVIASAEYNYGLPGVLKNALDWASRPYGKAKLTGKPVFTLTSSPAATGGVRAHSHLNDTLGGIAARVLLRPQAVIPLVHEKIADGRLTDASTLEFLLRGIDDLLIEIAKAGAVHEEA